MGKQFSCGHHLPRGADIPLRCRLVSQLIAVEITALIQRQFMRMPAAHTGPENSEFALSINLPDGFQIAEIDLIVVVNDDAPRRMRPRPICGERTYRNDRDERRNNGAEHSSYPLVEVLTEKRIQLLDCNDCLFLPST